MNKVVEGVIFYGNEKDGYIAYFDNWLKVNHNQSWDGIYNGMCEDSKSEDEIFEAKEVLLDEFYDWCEENEVQGEEV